MGKRKQAAVYRIDWYTDELQAALAEHLQEALFAGGQTLLREAVAKAPRDEGDLAESGYVATKTQSTYKKRKGYKNEVKPRRDDVAVIAFSAPHAHLVEFGTAKMKAQPFFRPAFDETKVEISETIVGVLREGLDD